MEEEAIWEWLPARVVEKILSVISAEDGCIFVLPHKPWCSEKNKQYPNFIRFVMDHREFNEGSKKLLSISEKSFNQKTYLEIFFNRGIGERSTIYRWVDCFTILLNHMEKSPLTYLEINNLWYIFEKTKDRKNYTRIHRAITTFLESQRQLQNVKIVNCMFTYEDNLEIVRSLANIPSISELWFECGSYVSFRTAELSQREQILSSLNQLPNLSVLQIDYSYVLGDHVDPANILGLLKSFKNLIALKIFLRVSSFSSNFKRFESSQWKNLKEEKPDLAIKMCIITNTEHWQQHESFIVKNMPVYYLHYTLLEESHINDLDRFIMHLASCGINDQLEILGFKLMSPDIPNLNSVSTFIIGCPKLDTFLLVMIYPQYRLEDLMESLANHCHSFLRVFLFIIGIGREENRRMLQITTSAYKDKFKNKVRRFVFELRL